MGAPHGVRRPRFASLAARGRSGSAGPTRRRFLSAAGTGGAALTAGGLLGACGIAPSTKSAAERAAPDRSAGEKVVNFSNWTQYIDVDDDNDNKRPTLEKFTKQTGIKVRYTEDITDNNDFFGKVRPQFATGADTGRDMIVLTDWMVNRLIRFGFIQELDKANLPNVAKNLRTALRNPSFDPHRDYSVPWQSGLTGIAYNAKVTGEVRSIGELLSRSDLKGRVTCLTEMRDTMLLVLLSLGKDPEKFEEDDFGAAIDRLQKAVDSGQIRKFTGNEYTTDLKSGNIAACMAWSGDVLQLQFEDENIKFVAPEEGLALWSDNMLVPNKARHKANAERLMNYYYDPKVAAELAAWVNYICPVEGAQAEMEKIDADLAKSPLIFPTDDFLSKTHIFRKLSRVEEELYEGQFQKVIGA